jgi:hypothetical protein
VVAKQGPHAHMLCMPNRTKCILFISVLWRGGAPSAGVFDCVAGVLASFGLSCLVPCHNLCLNCASCYDCHSREKIRRWAWEHEGRNADKHLHHAIPFSWFLLQQRSLSMHFRAVGCSLLGQH